MDINDVYVTLYENITSSPAVRDNSFKIIFLTTAYGFVCQIFAVLGSVANVINMVVFWKMGFKDSINISLFGLAFSDFGACFTLIWLNVNHLHWFQELDLPFHPTDINYLTAAWPHIIFTKITSLITAFIMVERCLCVTSPLKVKTIITRGRVTTVVMIIYVLVIGSYAPIYYSNRYALKFYDNLNKTLFGLVFTEDRQQIEAILGPIQNALFTMMPLVVVIVGTATLSVSLKRKAIWRLKATTGAKADELSTKDTSIAKMVVLISSLFIACFFPNAIVNTWLMVDSNSAIGGNAFDVVVILGSVIFTLEAINSAMNIFICYRNSSNYRAMFDKIFRREQQKAK